MSSSQSVNPSEAAAYRVTPYVPAHTRWPYSNEDFGRMDTSQDTEFYNQPRFVTHIDTGAIEGLRHYYEQQLPKQGRILDLCSSWISHLPASHEQLVQHGKLGIVGVGMNAEELERNPMLLPRSDLKGGRVVQDLNIKPELGHDVHQDSDFDSVTCVVSVDYLIQPVKVLSSAKDLTRTGGSIHLAISNRCFPSKAISRWLKISEDERLKMVGDYLWFSGWRQIEFVEVVKGGNGWFGLGGDPLWVVRGTNAD